MISSALRLHDHLLRYPLLLPQLTGLYMVVVGSRLASDLHLVMAFGPGIIASGAFVIICGLAGILNAITLNWGSIHHNKFVLLVVSDVAV
jgi:ribosomal protein S5